ncbi:hypothetical protein MWH28_08735 [Natroniella sulfidigena]|uniref:hypothetical protein n=1 Tax=Natroniella sulfidigena TaxID=723921 RepID=UPI00200AFB59|nr:hypothetical protein [Natroniella sulfidigena]MCK8817443.1 hypothetical protein [Natroniella sulfidigena]
MSNQIGSNYKCDLPVFEAIKYLEKLKDVTNDALDIILDEENKTDFKENQGNIIIRENEEVCTIDLKDNVYFSEEQWDHLIYEEELISTLDAWREIQEKRKEYHSLKEQPHHSDVIMHKTFSSFKGESHNIKQSTDCDEEESFMHRIKNEFLGYVSLISRQIKEEINSNKKRIKKTTLSFGFLSVFWDPAIPIYFLGILILAFLKYGSELLLIKLVDIENEDLAIDVSIVRSILISIFIALGILTGIFIDNLFLEVNSDVAQLYKLLRSFPYLGKIISFQAIITIGGFSYYGVTFINRLFWIIKGEFAGKSTPLHVSIHLNDDDKKMK